MADAVPDSLRAVLNRAAALERFQVTHRPPAADLTWLADHHWILHWDLGEGDSHRQRVLTHPSVHMTFISDGQARVVGGTSSAPGRRRDPTRSPSRHPPSWTASPPIRC
ncbi:DUF6597 domain-containing transcriptional factor [Actinoallomurus rhizosphaericola]|uniref:DUF6597 domain-containing transcriptional factor n=1 Tax=Actinoallomurus rhizosphaericola TaxID=2952536 RepID=UPI0020904085|nr:DUF6597 domain-containing transcriptional factor [Actinoallomurus rhizosphaericola]MCO5994123.1 hypothetical protein [Actinoallomurus rhizosphaericola]